MALLPASARLEFLSSLSEPEAQQLLYDWRGFWARPNQIQPDGDWLFWVLKAGRGFGKTRVGAETVREWAEDPTERILLVAPVASDVRETMIEGPSGLMQCYPPGARPEYNPSRHLITFPSGAVGITRSADEPERLRGPQFTKFWADEICAWRFIAEAWSQIMFGFRLPTKRLRGVITSTPKPIKTFTELLANPGTVVTSASSYENRANLSQTYYQQVIAPYEGTRLGRQEILGEVLDDVPGALWKRGMIDATRIRFDTIQWDKLVRIVVAIDPGVSTGENSDPTGIVCAALTNSGHGIVLDDLTCKESPWGWAKIAVSLLFSRHGDRIVGERNNGGDLVESNLRTINPNIPYRSVWASHGKATRAEPVAALYEQGRIHHAGNLSALEDEMCAFVPGLPAKPSPNRMDALVWAFTELFGLDGEKRVETIMSTARYQISPI